MPAPARRRWFRLDQRAHFRFSIDQTLAGEQVIITRRGKPVVEIRPASQHAEPVTGTHEWLRARTRAGSSIGLTSVEILDLMYESKED
jgi:antitoxin (DNA-binding transcriptional repressor) of toxin-antitoxin stability system